MSEPSDSSPLLSPSGGFAQSPPMQDHPVYLRVCHSPWRVIPQNILVILRGFLLTYLVAASILIGYYKLTSTSEYSQWRHVFDFAIISLAFTTVYHVFAFAWTFTHLYYPEPEDNEGGVKGFLIAAMSLPEDMASRPKQLCFSMFYATTCVFAFMNSAIYWFISRQHSVNGSAYLAIATHNSTHDRPFSDLFGQGWLKAFNLINLYAVSSVIMIVEIVFLNSIQNKAVVLHSAGVLSNAGIYLGWAAIGRGLTGWPAFYWLDKNQVGSPEAIAAYCSGFVLSAEMMYIVQHGFINIREGLLRSVFGPRRQDALVDPLED